MRTKRPIISLAILVAGTAPLATQAADVPAAPSAATGASAQSPGGRKGSGGRGGPLTDADRTAIAKLANLPAWKLGVGNGDYAMSPPYTPAPENAPRAGVPKGRVETFHLPLAGSKYFPPAAGRDGK